MLLPRFIINGLHSCNTFFYTFTVPKVFHKVSHFTHPHTFTQWVVAAMQGADWLTGQFRVLIVCQGHKHKQQVKRGEKDFSSNNKKPCITSCGRCQQQFQTNFFKTINPITVCMCASMFCLSCFCFASHKESWFLSTKLTQQIFRRQFHNTRKEESVDYRWPREALPSSTTVMRARGVMMRS